MLKGVESSQNSETVSRLRGDKLQREGREETPLVFVYLGPDFPSYASSSLQIALKTTPNPIVVLAEVPRPAHIPSAVEWIAVDSFYSGQEFATFTLQPPYSEEFRDGFWLKTAERFFVLSEFMQWRKLATIFHGELDCLFFDLPEVERQILEDGLCGVFLARETESRCIGSLVYVNDSRVLRFVCTFILRNSHLGNEMDILGAIPSGGEQGVYALPTAEFLYRESSDSSWPVAPRTPSFIVDGAVLGRWMFGVDPRNTGGRGTSNRIQNHKYGVPFESPLGALTFRRNSRKEWQTQVLSPRGGIFNLAVLHVHSKVHKKLTPQYIDRLVRRLSVGKSSMIAPLQFGFPLGVGRRVLRQLGVIIKTRAGVGSALKNLLSVGWWRGLRARLTDL
jgi:hypothetical protein